jgi:phosphohistidine phosphatase SixA
MPLRHAVLIAFGFWLATAHVPATADETGWKLLKAGGRVLVLRHALTTPGSGDPDGFRIDDCATQRNLVEEGREQARRFGRLLRERGIAIERVMSSAWCRCVETARLLEVGDVEVEPALNNLYGRPQLRIAQTAALREIVTEWTGTGNLLIVTHGANVHALISINPAVAAGVVLSPAPMADEGFRLVGRIAWDDR